VTQTMCVTQPSWYPLLHSLPIASAACRSQPGSAPWNGQQTACPPCAPFPSTPPPLPPLPCKSPQKDTSVASPLPRPACCPDTSSMHAPALPITSLSRAWRERPISPWCPHLSPSPWLSALILRAAGFPHSIQPTCSHAKQRKAGSLPHQSGPRDPVHAPHASRGIAALPRASTMSRYPLPPSPLSLIHHAHLYLTSPLAGLSTHPLSFPSDWQTRRAQDCTMRSVASKPAGVEVCAPILLSHTLPLATTPCHLHSPTLPPLAMTKHPKIRACPPSVPHSSAEREREREREEEEEIRRKRVEGQRKTERKKERQKERKKERGEVATRGSTLSDLFPLRLAGRVG
jgi:hypothetical protein